ncbi:hypothetical protein [Pseudolactococcus insecticola]|uniref:Uncharacterized protein n=1 Tax=Pseudolactococcus insecticola TaxID=2709158 RepID=A0A6A0B7U2_9LACT|nr:hypothetical protein [Lactococcus insecticola]GFH40855.1 hypothetical protein Hs20B_12530 [Lactococcus insecticola]
MDFTLYLKRKEDVGMKKYLVSFFNYRKALAVPISYAVVEADSAEQAAESVESQTNLFINQNGDDAAMSIRELDKSEYIELIDLADELENS